MGTRGKLKSYDVKLSREACIVPGSMKGLLTNEGMAKYKLANFDRMRKLYPEYCFVLCGDSGQGDISLGKQILSSYDTQRNDENDHEQKKKNRPIILIHDVIQ